jgi:hypothetical protein
MPQHAHGDPRRPEGDLVTGVPPFDSRTDPPQEEFGPKVGWGHDAVYRPEQPGEATENQPEVDATSASREPAES